MKLKTQDVYGKFAFSKAMFGFSNHSAKSTYHDVSNKYFRNNSLSVIFGRHVQKNCKVKINYLRHDQFYFISSFREPFPLSRITADNIMLTFLIKNIN